jgi:hypothetical protein
MAFVNEYVPEADIEKYDLKGIWDEFHPLRKGQYFKGNRPNWTMDRESEVFLMSIGIGRGEHGNRTKFLFWWRGANVVADLDLVEGSSGDLNASPFMRVWDLVRLELPSQLKGDEVVIRKKLKEALRAYGYWGIRSQRPNTVVEFKF